MQKRLASVHECSQENSRVCHATHGAQQHQRAHDQLLLQAPPHQRALASMLHVSTPHRHQGPQPRMGRPHTGALMSSRPSLAPPQGQAHAFALAAFTNSKTV